MNELRELLNNLKKEEEKKEKNKRKSFFSKLIVSFVIIINVIFTSAVLYVYLRTYSEPTTLITAWFAFTTVELWSLSKIKREKRRDDFYE